LRLTRYIHKNPLEFIKDIQKLHLYEYSSYPNYLNFKYNDFLEFGEVMKFFNNNSKLNYKSFVEDKSTKNDKNIEHLLLEEW